MQIYSKTQVHEIALALKSGKAVVLPTDTVWAIASLNEGQIYTIKHRALEKKVCKFVATVDEIGMPSFLSDVIRNYMPGALTVVWKDTSYRIPKCEFIIDIVKITGPLYQSSANISGQEPIGTSQQVFTEFKQYLDRIVIVDNSPYEQFSQKPSTIINLDTLTVIRQGEIDGERIIEEIKERKLQ
ncbi:MAG: Sua5/YciO/YrdC/YwlC family protein [Mycoplasma sp.]|nr:Sua5/YciO/YrdC/YwlC family protein [Candidatus Hennigella equi]